MIAIIPARGGSKGILKKNIQLLNKKPLVKWTTDFALSQKLIQKIIISTDSFEVIEALEFIALTQSEFDKIQAGSLFPEDSRFIIHKRRTEHATDDAPTVLAVNEIIEKLNVSMNTRILLLQPTSPFRETRLLEKIQEFPVDIDTSVLTVTTASNHPLKTFMVDGNLLQLNESTELALATPRQKLGQFYVPDGSIYNTSAHNLIFKKSFYSKINLAIFNRFPWNINIDEQKDLMLAQLVANNSIEI